MDVEKVLDAYQKGNEDERLSLFLGYRELRDEFNRIERDEDVVRPGKRRSSEWLKRIAGFL